MDFSLTEEQALMRDGARRYLSNVGNVAHRRGVARAAAGFDQALWVEFAQMGWTALAFAEEDGGLGGTWVDLAVLMEEFGRAQLVSPFPHTVAVGAAVLAVDHLAERAPLIEGVLAGETHLTLAWAEQRGRGDPAYVAARAVPCSEGFRVSGVKEAVAFGATADHLIVSARVHGSPRDPGGVVVLLVDRRSPGVAVSPYATLGGGIAAEVTLDDVLVTRGRVVADERHGAQTMRDLVNRAALMTCAEAVGTMQALLDGTVGYSKTRVQFGQRLASFQALQHRMVDMFSACEFARSIVYRAASLNDSGHPQACQAIHAAKAYVGKHGRMVGKEAVQLHGAIGVMDEFSIGHGLARLVDISQAFGDTAYHLREYAASSFGADMADVPASADTNPVRSPAYGAARR